MSTSQHPVALRLERTADSAPRLLAIVMFLPLIDGIFPALVMAGALDTTAGIVQVGLLVFGGSATLAVLLAEMDGSPVEQARIVLLIGIPLILVAALEAAVAPAIASLLDLVIFERFAAIVILAIAAQTASARIGEYLPGPAVIVVLGFVASIDLSGAALVVAVDPELVARGTAAAVVGVLFALGVALAGPWLRRSLDVDRFRFGSAVALGVLALSILGVVPGQAPLAVLVVAGVLSFDPSPDAGIDSDAETETDAETDDGDGASDRRDPDAEDVDGSAGPSKWLDGEIERDPWL